MSRMSRRFLHALAVMALLAPAAHAAPSLVAGTATGGPGTTVPVAFTLSNDSSVTALQFDVNFGADSLSVGVPSKGSALAATDHEIDSNLVSAGRFRVLVMSNSLSVIPSGQIVIIPFTVAETLEDGAVVPLTLTDVEMVEANALVVQGNVTHGQISVLEGCAVPGDVAPDGVGNGAISLADFVIARRKALGTLGQNAHDALCGNVHPGAVACAPEVGKISWCPNPNPTGNPIALGDVVIIRRLVAQTHQISCAACGAHGAAAAARVVGDVAPRGTGDGRLDVADVVLALRTSVGLEPVSVETILADVAPARRESGLTLADGDGRVDVADVVLLLRAAVGLETLVWPERALEVRATSPAPRIASSLRVSGWPSFVTLSGVTSDECPVEDGGIDAAGDRWGLTCATDPQVSSSAGLVATVTYTGPLVPMALLSVESTLTGPDLVEIGGLLTLSPR